MIIITALRLSADLKTPTFPTMQLRLWSDASNNANSSGLLVLNNYNYHCVDDLTISLILVY